MSKASTSLLEQIHQLLAEAMLEKLNDKDSPAEAKDWAVIVKFLKDNNIDALAGTDEDAENAFADLVKRAQESIQKAQ